MHTPNEFYAKEFGTVGGAPTHWFGVDTVDGDAYPWIQAAVGSTYVYRSSPTAAPRLYTKMKADGHDNDWIVGQGIHCITQTFSYSDFTDGGSTAGTLVLDEGIPVGAYVYRTVLVDVTGFTGDTSATIQVGDGTDVDRYSTGTPSVFTTANAIDLGAVSGTAIHTAAKSVTVTITSNSDWGAVTAGQATIRLYYFA